MRELTMEEIEGVSGAGFFSDLWRGLTSVATISADFLGFDGSFGYQGDGGGGGGGGFSFGNFFDAVGDAAGHIWALPNTLIGGAVGFVGFAFDYLDGSGNASITIVNGAIQFENNPFVLPGTALTLGDVQIYSGSSGDVLSNGTTFGLHESQHSSQQHIWGVFFIPAYIGAGIEALGEPDGFFGPGNFFEAGPYGSPPSRY